MKIKGALILLTMILTTLASLTPQTFAPPLSYPSPGQITKGTGGDAWNTWDDKEDAIPYFMSLADSYGGSYESIGTSSGNQGWDIVLFKFGNPNGGTVMLDSYMHGNEFYGYQVLKSVITWLVTSNDADATRILQNNYILVAPVVNYRWGRTNYNIPSWMSTNDPGNDGDDCGVNLNRNFGPNWPSSLSQTNGDSYSGTGSNSEAESQALINAWNKYNPRIYWNLHQGIGPSTACTAVASQAKTDANTVKSLLPSIQSRLGVSAGWSFSISSGYGSGYSKDGAASLGSAGFLTEVMSGWDATATKKANLETGDTFKQVKAMLIAMSQAVEVKSPQPQQPWSITISSSQGGTTSISGTRTVNFGQSLTVTANPGPSYKFDTWILDGNTFSSSRTVNIPSQNSGSSHTLYAQFSETSSNSRKLSSTGLIALSTRNIKFRCWRKLSK